MGKQVMKASIKYDNDIGFEKTKEILANELSKFLVDSEFVKSEMWFEEGNLKQSIELTLYDEKIENVYEEENIYEEDVLKKQNIYEENVFKKQKNVKNIELDKINETLKELTFITEIFKENQMKMISYFSFSKEENEEIFKVVEKLDELKMINEDIGKDYYIKVCNMFREILEIDNKLIINIDGNDIIVNVVNEKADGTLKYVKPLYLDKEKGEVILKEMDA